MKTTLFIPTAAIALSLLATGCVSCNSSQPDQTYTLKINFFGLIAFVEDEDRAWAFLVDADYDPGDEFADDYPPCAFEEANNCDCGDDEDCKYKYECEEICDCDCDCECEDPQSTYPPHYAYLKIPSENALRLPQALGTLRIPLKGTHIHLETDKQSQLSVQFSSNNRQRQHPDTGVPADLLSNAVANAMLEAAATNASPKGKISAARDTIDPTLLRDVTQLKPSKLVGRLSTRVVIDNGNLASFTDRDRGSNDPAKYGLRFPNSLPIVSHGLRILAEEVVWTISDLSSPAEIVFTPFGGGSTERLRIGPSPSDLDSPNPTVEIEIANQVAWAIASDDNLPIPDDHIQAFRWFYRLSDPNNRANECENDYYPRVRRGSFNGRKCPKKLFLKPQTGPQSP